MVCVLIMTTKLTAETITEEQNDDINAESCKKAMSWYFASGETAVINLFNSTGRTSAPENNQIWFSFFTISKDF